jgi:hypothetical protein
MLAPNVGTRETQLVTEKIGQMRAWLDTRCKAFAVDGHFDCVRPRQIRLAVRLVGLRLGSTAHIRHPQDVIDSRLNIPPD